MNNDFDLMNDDEFILTSSLKDLSDELLEECIKSQIDNPFTSKVDFLEQFYEEYENETGEKNVRNTEKLRSMRIVSAARRRGMFA